MPIVDVELVCASEAEFDTVSAPALADAIGAALGCAPGRTWVRLRHLPRSGYAENGTSIDAAALPAFVTVLHDRVPEGRALDAEVAALTHAIARVVNRSPERVHVSYAPAGAGRQAFGGVLVR